MHSHNDSITTQGESLTSQTTTDGSALPVPPTEE